MVPQQLGSFNTFAHVWIRITSPAVDAVLQEGPQVDVNFEVVGVPASDILWLEAEGAMGILRLESWVRYFWIRNVEPGTHTLKITAALSATQTTDGAVEYVSSKVTWEGVADPVTKRMTSRPAAIEGLVTLDP